MQYCGNNAAVLPQYKLVARKDRFLKLQYCRNNANNKWGVCQYFIATITLFLAIFYCQNMTITKTCLFKYTKNFTTRNWKFSDKNSDILHISARNIICGYLSEAVLMTTLTEVVLMSTHNWGSSNEYPQKKNNVYPCKPQFYYIKVGFKGSKLYVFFFFLC